MSVIGIGAAVGAAASIGGVVLQGTSASKQGRLANTQATLNSIASEQLAKAQASTDDRNAKSKIISDSVANIRATQIATSIKAKEEAKSADTKNKVILTIGGGVILVAAAFVLTRK